MTMMVRSRKRQAPLSKPKARRRPRKRRGPLSKKKARRRLSKARKSSAVSITGGETARTFMLQPASIASSAENSPRPSGSGILLGQVSLIKAAKTFPDTMADTVSDAESCCTKVTSVTKKRRRKRKRKAFLRFQKAKERRMIAKSKKLQKLDSIKSLDAMDAKNASEASPLVEEPAQAEKTVMVKTAAIEKIVLVKTAAIEKIVMVKTAAIVPTEEKSNFPLEEEAAKVVEEVSKPEKAEKSESKTEVVSKPKRKVKKSKSWRKQRNIARVANCAQKVAHRNSELSFSDASYDMALTFCLAEFTDRKGTKHEANHNRLQVMKIFSLPSVTGMVGQGKIIEASKNYEMLFSISESGEGEGYVCKRLGGNTSVFTLTPLTAGDGFAMTIKRSPKFEAIFRGRIKPDVTPVLADFEAERTGKAKEAKRISFLSESGQHELTLRLMEYITRDGEKHRVSGRLQLMKIINLPEGETTGAAKLLEGGAEIGFEIKDSGEGQGFPCKDTNGQEFVLTPLVNSIGYTMSFANIPNLQAVFRCPECPSAQPVPMLELGGEEDLSLGQLGESSLRTSVRK